MFPPLNDGNPFKAWLNPGTKNLRYWGLPVLHSGGCIHFFPLCSPAVTANNKRWLHSSTAGVERAIVVL